MAVAKLIDPALRSRLGLWLIACAGGAFYPGNDRVAAGSGLW